MERTALLERLTSRRPPILWHVATVTRVVEESAHARTLLLDVPDWPGHIAGQHVDLRLTSEDGYQAQRSYSIASAPEEAELALTVERFEDGEVSPYLTQELRAGDQFEVRGPVGGYFAWRVEDGGPLLLIGGGSGFVPLRSMLRHRALRDATIDARLLLSSGTWDDVLFRGELPPLSNEQAVSVRVTLTRSAPPGWDGLQRRVDAEMLGELGPSAADRPRVFLCGPTAFVEHVADLLLELGHRPGAIRAERFGPTSA
jgi:ferredoxin-NADP reductase